MLCPFLYPLECGQWAAHHCWLMFMCCCTCIVVSVKNEVAGHAKLFRLCCDLWQQVIQFFYIFLVQVLLVFTSILLELGTLESLPSQPSIAQITGRIWFFLCTAAATGSLGASKYCTVLADWGAVWFSMQGKCCTVFAWGYSKVTHITLLCVISTSLIYTFCMDQCF